MKSIIKWSNNMDALWNRIMAVIGGPFLIFIFMRYLESTNGGFTIARIVVFFFLGVMIMSPTFLEGIVSSILSYVVFSAVRPWFLKGLFGFLWWNHQTAFAAAVSVAFVNLVFFLVVLSRRGLE